MTALATSSLAGGRTPRPVSRHRLTRSGQVALAITIFTVPLALRGTGPLSSAGAILVVLAIAVVVVVSVIWPTIAVRSCRIEVRTPPDATVGDTVELSVTVRGDVAGAEVRALDPAGPWMRLADGVASKVGHVASRRGVFHHLRVEVRTTVPLGLFSAQRVLWLELPSPIHVAPVPLAVDWRPGDAPLEGRTRTGGHIVPSGELVRAVRPYVAGDPVRLVHWPTTARTGDLVVRELEPPVPLGQVVVLDLTGLGERAEQAASYALGACLAVLEAGGVLVLCTAEAEGPVAAEVPSGLVARRRIAAAVEGVPASAPEGWPLVEIGR